MSRIFRTPSLPAPFFLRSLSNSWLTITFFLTTCPHSVSVEHMNVVGKIVSLDGDGLEVVARHIYRYIHICKAIYILYIYTYLYMYIYMHRLSLLLSLSVYLSPPLPLSLFYYFFHMAEAIHCHHRLFIVNCTSSSRFIFQFHLRTAQGLSTVVCFCRSLKTKNAVKIC